MDRIKSEQILATPQEEGDYFEIPIENSNSINAAIDIIGGSFNEHYRKIIDNHALHLISMCEKIDEWNINNPDSLITEEVADFAYKEAMKQLDLIVDPFIETLKNLNFKHIRECFLDKDKIVGELQC